MTKAACLLAFCACLLPPVAAASVPAPPPPTSREDTTIACAIVRLKPFVGPYGIRQQWPVAKALPQGREHALGTLLSDTGAVADGYQQFLHVDVQVNAVYIVEQGGFAGTRKVFGPLPLPRCTTAPLGRP
ncbi:MULTISPECIES: hypothetical protein [unclassified Pseudoxanthomonas]|uniref:hypothetical protein n=1 Tax=unclassified Pseudoxanthomonas TaxID=2645906 RepID=UPI0008EA162B|nr:MULTISPECIES: hypothetical protein [unclassified Pseudoxanthomonas]PPJ41084.1 hypothetical protein C0063_14470 [Pseudoxanthomonas sp. KAs_5_3]SFV31293.1 hypothetical protein SAMN05428990_2009 [Pseudoxanthomonas sp. YR558]